MFVHEPLAGVDAQLAASMAQAVANDLRRLLSTAGDRSAARGGRRPAPRGQAGAAGAHAGLLRGLLRQVVGRVGVPGAAARRRRRRRPGAARAVHGADRPAALPRARGSRPTTSSRYAGSRRASTPSGCRAAPTRTRTSSSVAAGSPTSSGRCSCCRWSTPGAVPELRTTKTLEALRGRGGAELIERRRRRGPGRGLAVRQPGAQRDHAGARQAVRPAARATPASGRPWRAILQYDAGGVGPDGQRLPAHGPAGARGRGPDLLGRMKESTSLIVR